MRNVCSQSCQKLVWIHTALQFLFGKCDKLIVCRVSSVELSVVFSVEKMSVEKKYDTQFNNKQHQVFFKKQCFTPIIASSNFL